eukprot:803123-Prorocentrum_minimum.AAC.1
MEAQDSVHSCCQMNPWDTLPSFYGDALKSPKSDKVWLEGKRVIALCGCRLMSVADDRAAIGVALRALSAKDKQERDR